MTESSTSKRETHDSAVHRLWKSPWARWVGFRYLKSKKNSRFLSFITFISIFGVALGVTAMIVVLSVMDGFEGELKKRLMASDVHILITPEAEVPGFQGGYVPENVLADAGIESVLRSDSRVLRFSSTLNTEAILKTGRKVTGVEVKGATPERLERLRETLTESMDGEQVSAGGASGRAASIFIGQELAYEMGLIPGDSLTLISPTETEGPLDSVPRMKKFVVEGIYHSGMPEQELHTVYASDQAVRAFLRRTQVVSQWEVTLKKFDDAPRVARGLVEHAKKQGAHFRIQDWVQLNSHLFASLRLERIAMFVILAFIIVVASFNIVTTLTLMVLEKKKEIAILKAMGARESEVAAIFLSEGIFIGALGVGGGVVMGFLLCVLLKRYEFIKLPDVYYDRTLPVTFYPLYYTLVPLVALIIVLLACLYPSRRAARLNPLDGIRFG